jgi:hypothetical protein
VGLNLKGTEAVVLFQVKGEAQLLWNGDRKEGEEGEKEVA